MTGKPVTAAVSIHLTAQGEFVVGAGDKMVRVQLTVDEMRGLAGQLLAVSDAHEASATEADALLSQTVAGHA